MCINMDIQVMIAVINAVDITSMLQHDGLLIVYLHD